MSGLRAGDVFRRLRGFKRPPWGGRTWWVVGIIDPVGEAEAKGWHMLSIDEIVSTTTRGPIVIYREWLIDPDGNELPATKDWMPNRKAPLFSAGHPQHSVALLAECLGQALGSGRLISLICCLTKRSR